MHFLFILRICPVFLNTLCIIIIIAILYIPINIIIIIVMIIFYYCFYYYIIIIIIIIIIKTGEMKTIMFQFNISIFTSFRRSSPPLSGTHQY